MPEQGPTEEERVLITPDGKGKAAKRLALESARARHVRGAVEGLPKSQRGGVKVPGFWSDGEGMVCDPEHLIIALTKEIVS